MQYLGDNNNVVLIAMQCFGIVGTVMFCFVDVNGLLEMVQKLQILLVVILRPIIAITP